MVHHKGATLVLLQVVASDIGATVLDITESNVRQYLLELMYAVVAGQLPASKFIVGLKASGVSMEAQTPNMLVQLLWCASAPLSLINRTGKRFGSCMCPLLSDPVCHGHLVMTFR